MSAMTVNQAANDPDLLRRVTAMAHREVRANPTLAATDFGKKLLAGMANMQILMWSVAVETEADYEFAVNNHRHAPGADEDIISDGALTSAIVAGWPQDEPVVPSP